jgi:hypothetical protein
MKKDFEILKVTRQNILKLVNNLSEEQLLAIPKGFNNNILWNAGHILTANQRLCYSLAGQPMRIPEAYVAMYGKGTGPKEWKNSPDIKEVKELLLSSAEWIEQDYAAGVFKDYKEYQTSYGYMLKSIDEAITFNNVHEGVHLGVMMAMRKLV